MVFFSFVTLLVTGRTKSGVSVGAAKLFAGAFGRGLNVIKISESSAVFIEQTAPARREEKNGRTCSELAAKLAAM